MSTYTSSLGLEEITPGDQAGLWGNTTNNNLTLIDQAITGVTPITEFTGQTGIIKILESSNGAEDEARAAVLNITGIATGANTVQVPNKQKTYLVRNSTGQVVNFRTASPGDTFPVPAGNNTLIFCDGNNNVLPGIVTATIGPTLTTGGGTGLNSYTAGDLTYYAAGTSFTKLPIGAAGRVLTSSGTAPQWTETLGVANGGTGAGTFTSGGLLQGNGTGAVGNFVGSVNGQVATWNGSTWTARASGLGAGNFTNTNITVDAQGQITAISTGTGGSGVASVAVTSPIRNTGTPTAPNIGIEPNPTFSTSVTSPTYNLSSSTNRMTLETANEIQFYAGGVGSAKVTTTGLGCFNIATTQRALFGTSYGGDPGANFTVGAIGQANQTVAFFVTTGSSGNGIAINSTGGTTGAMLFQNNGTFCGSITTNGVNTFYNQSSDRRLKSNIADLTDSGSVIDALKPRTYTWNSTKESAKGFIADELQQVIPNAVQGQPNAVDEEGNPKYQAVDASTPEMIALMVAELQSLRKRVAELESKAS